MDFYEVLDQTVTLLQQRGKMTYRILKRQFDLDDETLEDLKEELLYSHPVVDNEGRGLIWTGEAHPAPEPASAAATSAQPDVTQQAQPAQTKSVPPEPPALDAERRQLTVMFCDLADSTKLSGQLDPEDLREVLRAYQDTAAEVIHQFEGYIAQYLGDGLLIYFGWPQAHEDDAQRAVHTGLGIVEAITASLNPRLKQEKDVQLTVRIGIHTGPVVVGEMGGGGRHENLATGETVNVAARLEGMAPPNTVVLSDTTARLVAGYFDCDDLGLHTLKGLATPMQAYRVHHATGVQGRLDKPRHNFRYIYAELSRPYSWINSSVSFET